MLPVCRLEGKSRSNDGRMESLQKQVGTRVRKLREKTGLSQEALAAVCNLHRTYVGLIERGERNLTLTTIQQIAEGLGVPPSELLAGLDSAPAPGTKPAPAKTYLPSQDVAAHLQAIRQILIDAKLTDAHQYDAQLRAILRRTSPVNPKGRG
jgi:transcriptional regulator with XRE-family HTH domain